MQRDHRSRGSRFDYKEVNQRADASQTHPGSGAGALTCRWTLDQSIGNSSHPPAIARMAPGQSSVMLADSLRLSGILHSVTQITMIAS